MKNAIVSKKVTGGIGAGMSNTYSERLPENLNDLEVGAITLGRLKNNKYVKYTSDTAIFDSPIERGESVQFATMSKEHTIKVSPKIDVDTLIWSKGEHISKNSKVVDLGYSSNTAATWDLGDVSEKVGQYVTIRIYDLDVKPEITNNFKTVSYQIRQGDTESYIHNLIYNRLKVYENTVFGTVTANNSGSDYGFTFTGKPGRNFKVIAEGVISRSPVTVVENIVVPIGDAADVLKLEKTGAVRSGYNPTESIHSNAWTSEFMTDADTEYDIFVLRWVMPNTHILAGGVEKLEQELVIACPVDGASPNSDKVSSQLEDLLSALTDQTIKWAVTA